MSDYVQVITARGAGQVRSSTPVQPPRWDRFAEPYVPTVLFGPARQLDWSESESGPTEPTWATFAQPFAPAEHVPVEPAVPESELRRLPRRDPQAAVGPPHSVPVEPAVPESELRRLPGRDPQAAVGPPHSVPLADAHPSASVVAQRSIGLVSAPTRNTSPAYVNAPPMGTPQASREVHPEYDAESQPSQTRSLAARGAWSALETTASPSVGIPAITPAPDLGMLEATAPRGIGTPEPRPIIVRPAAPAQAAAVWNEGGGIVTATVFRVARSRPAAQSPVHVNIGRIDVQIEVPGPTPVLPAPMLSGPTERPPFADLLLARGGQRLAL